MVQELIDGAHRSKHHWPNQTDNLKHAGNGENGGNSLKQADLPS